MSEVKLGEAPAEFRFEVEWESGNEQGAGVLIVNHYEVQAQLRIDGFAVAEDTPVDKHYVEQIASAVRATARPKDLVAKMTDAQLYAKGNEAIVLFQRLGESGRPSQTSRRPTESSIVPPGSVRPS